MLNSKEITWIRNEFFASFFGEVLEQESSFNFYIAQEEKQCLT